jgi:hypothetical protein
MSFFPCQRCGCWGGCIGMTVYECCCAVLDERLKLVGVLVARERQLASRPPGEPGERG